MFVSLCHYYILIFIFLLAFSLFIVILVYFASVDQMSNDIGTLKTGLAEMEQKPSDYRMYVLIYVVLISVLLLRNIRLYVVYLIKNKI